MGDYAGQVELFLNNGTGGFTSKGIVTDVGSNAYGMTSADFDGDNDTDFLVGDYAGQVELFLNNGTGGFTSKGIVTDVGSNAYGMTSADFDGDNDTDFLVGDYAGQVEVFFNNGAGGFTSQGIITDVGSYAGGLTSADFDGDNDTDFLVGDYDGQIEYYIRGGPWAQWPGCFDVEDENNPIFFNDTQRLSLAKCLDKYFTDTILNTTGSRMGLVHFSTSAYDSTGTGLSDDIDSLYTAIDSYSAGGGTCVCCAINRAYAILDSQSSGLRNKFIVVMTDGVTGYNCGGCGYAASCNCSGNCASTTGSYSCGGNPSDCSGSQCDAAINDAICASRRSRDELNATVYSVGFGPIAAGCPNANRTMHGVADCGNGTYYGSSNTSELMQIYQDIAGQILNATYQSQIINITGELADSILYADESYIEYEYTSIDTSGYGDVSITKSTDAFNDIMDCDGVLFVPSDARVVDAKATSYSSQHWSDYVVTDNSLGIKTAYTLRDKHFGDDYTILGDPFMIHIPAENLPSGENNTIIIRTGDGPDTGTGCSPDNRIIYTVMVKRYGIYGGVLPEKEGCNWTIEAEDGTMFYPTVPKEYNGTKTCFYTDENVTYNENDSIDEAVFRLMDQIDLDNDGLVDIEFDPDDLEISYARTGGVRSLWGPIRFKLVLWM